MVSHVQQELPDVFCCVRIALRGMHPENVSNVVADDCSIVNIQNACHYLLLTDQVNEDPLNLASSPSDIRCVLPLPRATLFSCTRQYHATNPYSSVRYLRETHEHQKNIRVLSMAPALLCLHTRKRGRWRIEIPGRTRSLPLVRKEYPAY